MLFQTKKTQKSISSVSEKSLPVAFYCIAVNGWFGVQPQVKKCGRYMNKAALSFPLPSFPSFSHPDTRAHHTSLLCHFSPSPSFFLSLTYFRLFRALGSLCVWCELSRGSVPFYWTMARPANSPLTLHTHMHSNTYTCNAITTLVRTLHIP